MTLQLALKESKLAVDYFFNNDLERAREIVKPW